MSLFAAQVQAPLAERLRPTALDQVIGQDRLVGPDGTLSRMVRQRRLTSFILWGPPGSGKTTIARLVAGEAGLAFRQLSAVLAGVADLRREIEAARERRTGQGRQTALFIDELHRFSRTTQDALLPHLEDGTLVLIGATTENPSFRLVAALLSRAQVFPVARLDEAALEQLMARAERFTGRALPVEADARAALAAMADGDGRFLLGLCEELLARDGERPLSRPELAAFLHRRAPVHDAAQDAHYDLLSCFHKSVRGSDADAALYWAARMVAGGEDPGAVFRRLACAASEDVGLADPQAMVQVLSAWDAFERVGWPEGRLFLAQAIVYVSTAPKSNACHRAFDDALALVERTGSPAPPRHLVNAPTRLMRELGHGAGYRYDHDEPDAFSGQDHLPDALQGRDTSFYRPNERGFERDLKRRLAFWAERKRSRPG